MPFILFFYCIRLRLLLNCVENQEQQTTMKLFDPLMRLMVRIRYPVSLPEDIASDLGITISNHVSFSQFIDCITNSSTPLTKLYRFMPKSDAESNFKAALRKECFSKNTLISYYFSEGWVEFLLQYDDHLRLRRLYIRHKSLKCNHEILISQFNNLQ